MGESQTSRLLVDSLGTLLSSDPNVMSVFLPHDPLSRLIPRRNPIGWFAEMWLLQFGRQPRFTQIGWLRVRMKAMKVMRRQKWRRNKRSDFLILLTCFPPLPHVFHGSTANESK